MVVCCVFFFFLKIECVFIFSYFFYIILGKEQCWVSECFDKYLAVWKFSCENFNNSNEALILSNASLHCLNVHLLLVPTLIGGIGRNKSSQLFDLIGEIYDFLASSFVSSKNFQVVKYLTVGSVWEVIPLRKELKDGTINRVRGDLRERLTGFSTR